APHAPGLEAEHHALRLLVDFPVGFAELDDVVVVLLPRIEAGDLFVELDCPVTGARVCPVAFGDGLLRRLSLTFSLAAREGLGARSAALSAHRAICSLRERSERRFRGTACSINT